MGEWEPNMVDWREFDQRQREIFQQQQTVGDMRNTMFDFPASDPTQLLQKPMDPTDDFGGLITRDTTTANFPEKEAREISFLLTSAVALDGARELFEIDKYPEADKWLVATIRCIKASSASRSAVSKGVKGWLGELFVTLKRKGEIAASFVKEKRGILG